METAPVIPPAPKHHPSKKVLLILFAILAFFILFFISGFILISKRKPTLVSQSTPQPIETPAPTEVPLETILPVSMSPSPILESTPQPTDSGTKRAVLKSSPQLDGHMSSNGSGSTTSDIRVGRNVYFVTRGFLNFELNQLPPNIKVETAYLRLYQTNITGNPYSAGGSLKVDHINFGNSLEAEDYSIPALTTNYAVLATQTQLEWKEIVVTDALRDDLDNARLKSQYRIHFTVETIGTSPGAGDYAHFEPAEDISGTHNTPELVILYSQ